MKYEEASCKMNLFHVRILKVTEIYSILSLSDQDPIFKKKYLSYLGSEIPASWLFAEDEFQLIYIPGLLIMISLPVMDDDPIACAEWY